MEYVDTISTDLQTDDDFANAEGVSKWCKNAEKKIKTVKEQAMTQAADINAVFSLLDEVSAALRDKRLSLDRQVKALKEIRKQEATDKAMTELTEHVNKMESTLDGLKLPSAREQQSDFATAAKGKRTLYSVHASLDAALRTAKSGYQAKYQVMFANVTTLRANDEWSFLFADAQHYADKAPDDFENLVKVRIREHQEAEKVRLEAERDTIRAEERAKVEAEMQPTTAPAPDLPDTEPATPATFEDRMQKIMFAFTALVDRMGREEFLKTCGLSVADYEEIKQAWRDNLGVEV